MLSIVSGDHALLIYETKNIGHQIYFSDKGNFGLKQAASPCCHGNSDIVKTEF